LIYKALIFFQALCHTSSISNVWKKNYNAVNKGILQSPIDF